MKKTICAVLAAVLCLCTLSACSGGSGVSVNGTEISKGVYLYFTDEAKKENPDADEAALKTAVNQMISEYVAVNSIYADRGLSLSADAKMELTQTVNSLWRLFGTYYTELGVTKQDLNNVEANKQYRDALIVDYYAPDGDEPIAEETLKTYFNQNYIAFKNITGFLTTVDNDGNAVPLSDAEKTALTTSFTNIANAVNGGSSIEEQANALDNTIVNTETVVISKADTRYPAEFFTAVAAIPNGTAQAFTAGDYIFVVQREDITDEDRDLYSQYRTDCLKMLKGEAFEQVLAGWAKLYPVSE